MTEVVDSDGKYMAEMIASLATEIGELRQVNRGLSKENLRLRQEIEELKGDVDERR